jgi:hypothetical protein
MVVGYSTQTENNEILEVSIFSLVSQRSPLQDFVNGAIFSVILRRNKVKSSGYMIFNRSK